mmetsp:Transcript_23603/g.70770  ORF Transcript_23603/g.70770 Transcript_23603/m.70770 type:complete len:200 (+) Transcript_23603:194-793(+)
MMGSRGRPTLEASEKGPHPYLFRARLRTYSAGIRSGSSKPLPTKNDATCCLTSINSARGGSSSRESTSTNTEATVCRDHLEGECCSSSSSVSTSVAHSTSSTATGFACLSAHAHNSHSNSRGGARSSKDLSSVFSTDSNSTRNQSRPTPAKCGTSQGLGLRPSVNAMTLSDRGPYKPFVRAQTHTSKHTREGRSWNVSW